MQARPVFGMARSRLALFGGAALLLAFSLLDSTSASERFHALLVPLWMILFALGKRRFNKRSLIFGAGLGVGLLGVFWMVGTAQTQLLGARLAWQEPFQKLLFTAGLFVLYNGLCVVLDALIAAIPAASKQLKSPQGRWLRGLRMSVALCLFAPYLYVGFNSHRFKYADATDPRAQFHLAYENVNFAASDGLRLRGWFIPNSRSRGTILMVHGIGSSRGDVLSLAPWLHRAGFGVFLFDLRSHGDSDGHTTTFGPAEARDVEAAASWVDKRTAGQPVGIYAFSMGGSAALYALGDARRNDLHRVRAVVLDSTFSQFEPLARHQMEFLPKPIVRPLLAMVSFYTRLEIGTKLSEIAPGQFIGVVAPRPLLLIHGTADNLIPPEQARLNFAHAKPPKSLYWIVGAGHCAGHSVAGAAYEARVGEFFQRALR